MSSPSRKAMRSLLRRTGEYSFLLLCANHVMTLNLDRGAGWKKKAKSSVRAMSYWDQTRWRENTLVKISAKRSVFF